MANEISGLFFQVFTYEIKLYIANQNGLEFKKRLIPLNSAQVSKLETIIIEIN